MRKLAAINHARLGDIAAATNAHATAENSRTTTARLLMKSLGGINKGIPIA